MEISADSCTRRFEMKVKIVSENAVALIMCILDKDLSSDAALRKCGIKIPCSRSKTINKSIIPEDESEKIYKYYNEDNKTLTQIGEMYGVSAMTVSNFMKRSGIEVRTRGRRMV